MTSTGKLIFDSLSINDRIEYVHAYIEMWYKKLSDEQIKWTVEFEKELKKKNNSVKLETLMRLIIKYL